MVKYLLTNAGDKRDAGSIPVRKILWQRAWQPTPVFLLRESHGQKSLMGYSSLGRKELDMTEATYYTCLNVVAVFSLIGILNALLGTEEGT